MNNINHLNKENYIELAEGGKIQKKLSEILVKKFIVLKEEKENKILKEKEKIQKSLRNARGH